VVLFNDAASIVAYAQIIKVDGLIAFVRDIDIAVAILGGFEVGER
jgi:hypothetical protein